MTRLVEYYIRASDGFAERIAAVVPAQWSAPTPCSEWDVRALSNHVLAEQLWVAPLLAGETISDVGDRLTGDQLGEDAFGSWTAARAVALEAVSAGDALGGTVHLSYGEEAAETYLWQVTADTLIHSWDLARAIGESDGLDPECVEAVAGFLGPHVAAWQSAGAFALSVPVSGEADAQTRLLALTGRR